MPLGAQKYSLGEQYRRPSVRTEIRGRLHQLLMLRNTQHIHHLLIRYTSFLRLFSFNIYNDF